MMNDILPYFVRIQTKKIVLLIPPLFWMPAMSLKVFQEMKTTFKKNWLPLILRWSALFLILKHNDKLSQLQKGLPAKNINTESDGIDDHDC